MHPLALARVRAEIEGAQANRVLSTPIQYEETRLQLPFMAACIKEGLRILPPAPQILARIVPEGGKVIDGYFVPGGVDVTSHAYIVQRDGAFYGEDATDFKPERWMVSEKRTFELEAAQLSFGTGARGCMGKDVAMMELYKLLPEVCFCHSSSLPTRLVQGSDLKDDPQLRYRSRAARKVYSYWRGCLQRRSSRYTESQSG